MDSRRFIRDDIQDLSSYVSVKPLEVLATEIGVPVDELVKLDANENPYGTTLVVLEAAASVPLHIYPDPAQGRLRSDIAAYLGVGPEQVVAGTGSDELLDLILRLTLPTATATATPTFGMYSFLSGIAGIRHVEVPRNSTFDLDLVGLRNAVGSGAGVVFVASPNNPTGNAATLDEIEELCGLDALIVVDEAYAEFAGTSAIPLLERYENLIVMRTFSKWAGLAGLRVGYAVAHPDLVEPMLAIKQPYNVNVAADAAARAALAHRDELLATVRTIVVERDRLSHEVGTLGWLVPYPSDANFVLFDVEKADASAIAASLRERGVLVRHYDRADLSNKLRISAGRPQDTDRLVKAFKEVGPK
ncbi:MAG: histidinol-phosphate transaminase [Dehalococcoidia bacterium]|nr:histidinol-phosphate transaminase [Dehalococcoidia bacterium]